MGIILDNLVFFSVEMQLFAPYRNRECRYSGIVHEIARKSMGAQLLRPVTAVINRIYVDCKGCEIDTDGATGHDNI